MTQSNPDSLEPGLRLALASVFRSPDAFSLCIQRGIALEREREEARAERLQSADPGLRLAAGLLPPGLLPPILLRDGLVLGAGQKLGAKGLAALVATPAIAFVMVIVSVVAGLGKLWGSTAKTAPSADTPPARTDLSRAWWRRNRRPALVSLALVALLALFGHSETALMCVLLSMAFAVLLLAEFARAGLSDARSVGRWTAGLLWGLGLYGFFLRQFLPVGAGPSNLYTALSVLFIGALLCLAVSGQLGPRRLWDLFDAPVQRLSQRDLPTVICLRALMGLLAVGVLCGLLMLLAGLGFGFVSTRPSPERLLDYARSFDEPTSELSRWKEFEHVVEFLSDDGKQLHDLPDLGPAIAAMRLSRSQGLPFFAPIKRAAARFGFLKDEELRALVPEIRSGPLSTGTIQEFYPGVEDFDVYALLALGALDLAARERLADLLVSNWPAPDAEQVLSDLRSRIELLEALDQAARWTPKRADVRRALELTWPATHHRWRPAATFLWDASSAAARWTAGSISERPPLWEPTDDALFLAGRVGLPNGMDLEPLRANLAHALQVRRFAQHFGGDPRDDIGLELVALRLERLLPDLAPRGPIGKLIEMRLFLAVSGLVALCVLACVRGSHPQPQS